MATIPEKFDPLIASAVYVWCTTVRPDGTPHTTPIWFIRDGGSFYFYTIPGSQKVRNLAANPHISLSFAADHEGEEFFVVEGTAAVDDSLPKPHLNDAYMAKYRSAPYMIEATPEKYSLRFSLPVRVTPTRVRGID
ncbi:MAG: PPOX class F420-dependent oxidoreductase [Anaerolineae bacterium]|nr:PPOX class F420-dependent oxidoreductase [Anaerolineae bacterium]NUQ03430.1 TIGR03618 family F420-dependent PPOX class oxidoreductase [Anaerolineae bacterium]